MSVYSQGDPAWAKASSNLVSLFDPKSQAEGEALRARRGAFEAQARKDAAAAAGLEDQNTALAIETLIAAGYSPQQIAAMRAARSGSVRDIAEGTGFIKGGDMLLTPDADRAAALGLMGQAAAAPNFPSSSGALPSNPARDASAMRFRNLVTDAVMANLGAVKGTGGKPTTIDFDGKRVPVDPTQLSALIDKVASSYDAANDPEISDNIEEAFKALGLDPTKKEAIVDDDFLFPDTIGARWASRPTPPPAAPNTGSNTRSNTGSNIVPPTPGAAPNPPVQPSAPSRTGGNAPITIRSRQDVVGLPEGQIVIYNGKRYVFGNGQLEEIP